MCCIIKNIDCILFDFEKGVVLKGVLKNWGDK